MEAVKSVLHKLHVGGNGAAAPSRGQVHKGEVGASVYFLRNSEYLKTGYAFLLSLLTACWYSKRWRRIGETEEQTITAPAVLEKELKYHHDEGQDSKLLLSIDGINPGSFCIRVMSKPMMSPSVLGLLSKCMMFFAFSSKRQYLPTTPHLPTEQV